MIIKHLPTAAATFLFLPLLAHAQTKETSRDDSVLMQIVYTVLPLLILTCFVYLVIRCFQTGPRAQRTEKHMERVEQSLERIATAVERKEKDDA